MKNLVILNLTEPIVPGAAAIIVMCASVREKVNCESIGASGVDSRA